MIEVKNLCKSYGKNIALNNISFNCEKGSVIGFLGPNGAGKTTMLNILTGCIYKDSGSIKINNIDIDENINEAKKLIGYMPEKPYLYKDLTVIENLSFAFSLKNIKGLNKKEELNKIMEITNIKDMENRLSKNLSKGYKQRVCLGMAMIGSPEILILDEPMAGLDPSQIIETRNIIKNYGTNKIVIFSSHILSEVSEVSKKIMTLNKGSLINLKKENLNKNFKIMIETNKEFNVIKHVLESISEISSILEINNNVCHILATKDIRHIISKKLVDNNVHLLMLQKIDTTLEESFINLLKEDNNDLHI